MRPPAHSTNQSTSQHRSAFDSTTSQHAKSKPGSHDQSTFCTNTIVAMNLHVARGDDVPPEYRSCASCSREREVREWFTQSSTTCDMCIRKAERLAGQSPRSTRAVPLKSAEPAEKSTSVRPRWNSKTNSKLSLKVIKKAAAAREQLLLTCPVTPYGAATQRTDGQLFLPVPACHISTLAWASRDCWLRPATIKDDNCMHGYIYTGPSQLVTWPESTTPPVN